MTDDQKHDHDPVLKRIHDADPASRLHAEGATLSRLLNDAKRPRSSRRRRLFIIGASVAGMLAIAVAAPAAAGVVRTFLAQTGTFGNVSSTETDATEWIDLLAPDAGEYIIDVYPNYLPIPPGVDAGEFQLQVAEQIIAAAHATSALEGGVGIQQQRTGLVRSFEQTAYGEWIRTWLVADLTGDLVTRDTATATLWAACSWPALVATDGGGIIAWMQTFADAAQAGDRVGMQAAAQYYEVAGPGGWDGVDRTPWLTEHQP
jgi:hypothetical protein